MGVHRKDASKSGVGGKSKRTSLARRHLTGDQRNVQEFTKYREKLEKTLQECEKKSPGHSEHGEPLDLKEEGKLQEMM